jgi:hypothetical protein
MLVFEGRFHVTPHGDGGPAIPTYARSLVGWRCLEHASGKNDVLGITDESWGTAQAAMEIRLGSPLVGLLRCGLSIFTETDVARIQSELRVGAEKPVLPPPVHFLSEEEFRAATKCEAS